ncbi:MAG: 3-deoxy-manno-octulosonate cytidylyltransferase [Elusimicrobia bacterium]|nr:3-deoxy-manno-octulosonate cytidylyltransferase [Elusimicrobiota bacterium]
MAERVVAIIPARMASTRFPGKPMAKLHGMPMIGHVYFRTRLAKTVAETWVATCDAEIFDYVRSLGGKAVMTADTHARCTERTAEAVLKIEAETGRRTDIVAMVQGDEPMVDPQAVDLAVQAVLDDPNLQLACLMAPLSGDAAFEDPNQVKVVVDLKGNALYFSREPIPSRKKGAKSVPMFRQYPIIPFRRDYLLRFTTLPATPLEKIESVDLMRCLEHGDRVRMIAVKNTGLSVDTPQDLKAAARAMKADKLMKSYAVSEARR